MDVNELFELEELRKKLFAPPWKYLESLVIIILLLLLGITLECLSHGRNVRPLAMPYNLYVGFIYISALLIIHFRYKNWAITKWLSSVPAAICSIGLFAALVLVFGLLPQGVSYTSIIIKCAGLDHVKTSWLFLLSQLFFLTTLGMVIIRRAFPLNVKNLGFFLNHTGLFLTLFAALLGAGDIRHLGINLLKGGNESNIGVSGQGNMFKLPFSLQLIDFTIEEYNTRLGIINSHTGEFVNYKDRAFPMVEKGLKTTMLNWNIQILNYLPNALVIDSVVQSSNLNGNCPAVNVRAINKQKRDTVTGWVLLGSYFQEPIYLPLDTTKLLVLTKPEPKRYKSEIVVRTDSLKTDTIALEVNKPYTVKGWKIYQVSYDLSKGKWSSLSVLEAVSDPWLPVVYTGIFMMMAGSVVLFWLGKAKKRLK